jgi:hypothetical protein
MGKTRRGGVKWREGVDTCVFKPPVACADGTPIPPDSVSRIRMAARAGRDALVEDKIKAIIAALPEGERPVLANGVVVYSTKCTPSYTAEDVGETADFVFRDRHGCAKLDGVREGSDPRHVNLLTPQWGETVDDLMFPNDLPNKDRIGFWRSILQNAILASVALVPDRGPWVIHADCHFGNVLTRGNPTESAINDWGRAIIIQNPTDLASVRQGITDWVRALFPQLRPDATTAEIAAKIDRIEDMRQHPRFILDKVASVFGPAVDVDELAEITQTIRGWVPYVLVTQAVRIYNHTHNPLQDFLYYRPENRNIQPGRILRARNQMALREICNQILVSVPQPPRAGGAQWKEGADTCVFKPAVKCEGEAERRPGISRIGTVGTMAREIAVETALKNSYSVMKYDNVPGAVVSTETCTPEYDASDLERSDTVGREDHGCSKLQPLAPGPNAAHVNLVTPEWDGDVATLFRDPEKNKQWRTILRDVFEAAVTFVPDDGPWIIHTDCHLGNILYYIHRRNGSIHIHTALADWGRTLIIETPTNEGLIKGIKEWAVSRNFADPKEHYLGIGYKLKTHADKLDMEGNPYPQLPSCLVHQMAKFMQNPHQKPAETQLLQMLRGFVPYVLINQTDLNLRSIKTKELIFPVTLLESANQRDLRERVEEILTSTPFEAKGGVYWPTKYFRGLTQKQNAERKRSATRRTKMSFKDPKAYVPFKSDKGVKTRRSSYTQRFHKKYPNAKTLPEIAKATGISKSVLQEVYDRGMAAWRTGHRPGASQHAWGMARVHSFAMKGKTWRTADKDLAGKV